MDSAWDVPPLALAGQAYLISALAFGDYELRLTAFSSALHGLVWRLYHGHCPISPGVRMEFALWTSTRYTMRPGPTMGRLVAQRRVR
jgi:hypothetical protein